MAADRGAPEAEYRQQNRNDEPRRGLGDQGWRPGGLCQRQTTARVPWRADAEAGAWRSSERALLRFPRWQNSARRRGSSLTALFPLGSPKRYFSSLRPRGRHLRYGIEPPPQRPRVIQFLDVGAALSLFHGARARDYSCLRSVPFNAATISRT